jgi:hypothetical protein
MMETNGTPAGTLDHITVNPAERVTLVTAV